MFAIIGAFCYYLVFNSVASHEVIQYDKDLKDEMSVYEGMLLLTAPWVSILLGATLYLIALVNIVFTTLIAVEQIFILFKELVHQAESMKIFLYLKVKDRFMAPSGSLRTNLAPVEVTYLDERPGPKRIITTLLLVLFAALLSVVPTSVSSILITAIGAFSAPMVHFILPGYLFYDF